MIPTMSVPRGVGREEAMKRPVEMALASWGFRPAMEVLSRISWVEEVGMGRVVRLMGEPMAVTTRACWVCAIFGDSCGGASGMPPDVVIEWIGFSVSFDTAWRYFVIIRCV